MTSLFALTESFRVFPSFSSGTAASSLCSFGKLVCGGQQRSRTDLLFYHRWFFFFLFVMKSGVPLFGQASVCSSPLLAAVLTSPQEPFLRSTSYIPQGQRPDCRQTGLLGELTLIA